MLMQVKRIVKTYPQMAILFALELFGVARYALFPTRVFLPHNIWVETAFTLAMLLLISYFFTRVFVVAKTKQKEPLYYVMLSALAVALIANLIVDFARAYCELGLVDGGKLTTDAGTCLYFSLITWTTVGYGDVYPAPATRVLAASEALVAYFVMAALIGLFVVTFNAVLGAKKDGAHDTDAT